MGSYRAYYRDVQGGIIGRDDFLALDDTNAITIARLVREACSDLCGDFEVWHGTALVRGVRMPIIDAAEVSAASQESARRYEETILQSHWAIGRSRQLLQRLSAK